MNKALILTNVKLTEQEQELIRRTNIFKVALNNHANELLPDIRYTSDYIAVSLLNKYPQPVYSNRDKNAKSVNVPFSGYSIVDCARWLLNKGYTVILVADNTVHSTKAQEDIKQLLANTPNLYVFKEGTNFKDIKCLSI